MRKLTVKNFSVIKDAELEFGKITVLIGPQSSGKSLLCKLAYFLGKELVDLSVSSLSNRVSWDLHVKYIGKEFLQRFSNYDLEDWNGVLHEVTFMSFQYEVSIRWMDDPYNFDFQFSRAYQDLYLQLFEDLYGISSSFSGASHPGRFNPSAKRYENWLALSSTLCERVVEQTVYVPAGRAFFTSAGKGFALLQNPSVDRITREFATQIQWDASWKVGLLTSGRGVTDEINRLMTEICRGFVYVDGGVPQFLSSKGHKLPLEMLSTGVQELTPLFNVLEQWMYVRENSFERARAFYDPPNTVPVVESKPLIYLEEPEANVFPATQYRLVQLFSWLSSDPILNFSWVITTHSPYVLSSFNNLLEAWQTGHMDEQRAEAVRAVIDEKYWLNPAEFRAYAIEDGVLISIIADDTKLISENYLDSVSETIGAEFDELLRIGYVEA